MASAPMKPIKLMQHIKIPIPSVTYVNLSIATEEKSKRDSTNRIIASTSNANTLSQPQFLLGKQPSNKIEIPKTFINANNYQKQNFFCKFQYQEAGRELKLKRSASFGLTTPELGWNPDSFIWWRCHWLSTYAEYTITTTPTNACKKFRNLRMKDRNVWEHGVRICDFFCFNLFLW